MAGWLSFFFLSLYFISKYLTGVMVDRAKGFIKGHYITSSFIIIIVTIGEAETTSRTSVPSSQSSDERKQSKARKDPCSCCYFFQSGYIPLYYAWHPKVLSEIKRRFPKSIFTLPGRLITQPTIPMYAPAPFQKPFTWSSSGRRSHRDRG